MDGVQLSEKMRGLPRELIGNQSSEFVLSCPRYMPASLALEMGADNAAPPFLARQSPAIEVRRALFHAGGQINALYGAYFGESRAAKRHSSPAATVRGLLLHG
jgi:hypothetical protein